MDTYIEKLYARLSFYDIAFAETEGWFCDVFSNTLCKMNLDTMDLSVETMIPAHGYDAFYQYGAIGKWENTIVLAPLSSKEVILYQIDQKSFTSIPLSEKAVETVGTFSLFSDVAIYQNYAFLLPGRYPAIVKVDLVRNRITEIDDWYQVLKDKISDFHPDVMMFERCDWRSGNKLYLSCCQINIVMEFDMETEGYRFLEFPSVSGGLFSACMYRNEFVLSARGGNEIVFCDLTGAETRRIRPDMIGQSDILFLTTFEKNLIIVPVYGDKLISMEPDSGVCTVIGDLPTEVEDIPTELLVADRPILSCIPDFSGNLWMYSVYDGTIIKLNMYTLQVIRKEATISHLDEIKKRMVFSLKRLRPFQLKCEEGNLYTLKDFCECLLEINEEERQNPAENNVSAGSKIFNCLKKCDGCRLQSDN